MMSTVIIFMKLGYSYYGQNQFIGVSYKLTGVTSIIVMITPITFLQRNKYKKTEETQTPCIIPFG